MSTIYAVIKDMRERTRKHGYADAAAIIGYFDTITNGAFNINYVIIEAADVLTKTKTKSKYHLLSNCPNALLIISTKREYTGVRTQLHSAMNGIVVQFPDWRIVSAMPNFTDNKFNIKTLTSDIGGYTIYPAIDATLVTLYFHGGKWKLSTSNAIDASAYTWLGTTTYMEAITELSAQYPDFSIAKLDKHRCYTISFTHPAFQLLSTTAHGMRFIQSAEVGGDAPINQRTDENIGLPLQEPLTIDIDTILSKKDSALADYIADNSQQCYGYILRRKQPDVVLSSADAGASANTSAWTAPAATTSKHDSDYIIESRLMLYIRKVIYDLPKVATSDVILGTPQQRIEYICIRAFLTPNFRTNFLTMFPQFAPYFEKYTATFKIIQNRVIAYLGQNAGATAAAAATPTRVTPTRIADTKRPPGKHAPKAKGQRNEPPVVTLDNIVSTLAIGLSTNDINVNSSQTFSIIEDYVGSSDHITMYYNYFVTQ